MVFWPNCASLAIPLATRRNASISLVTASTRMPVDCQLRKASRAATSVFRVASARSNFACLKLAAILRDVELVALVDKSGD